MTDIIIGANEALLLEWQDRIRIAASKRNPLRLRGGGSKDFYGQTLDGEIFDTSPYTGIVSYEPTELVITARCGTPLAELEREMAARGQMLAFEPPHFGAGATIGGAIASGLSGPRCAFAGAVREFVLGVRILDGNGENLRFGGQVMKNVAGFDVSRLMVGALGTLGLILEVSIKAAPIPKQEKTLAFELPANDALDQINKWSGQSLPISASAYIDGRLRVRLSGALAAVDAGQRVLGGELVDNARDWWKKLREHELHFFKSAPSLWRLSVKSTAPIVDLNGPQLIEWGGALRWLSANTDADPTRIRTWAKENGGHATLFRGDNRLDSIFSELSEPLAEIHRRLKHTFDPAGVFNRGRLYSWL